LDFHDPGSLVRRAHLEDALGAWPDGAPEAVLDFGCGKGRHSFMLASRWPGARAVGLDVDADALAAARRRAVRRGLAGVSFSEAASLEAEAGSFDVAVCIDVLEHIDDDAAALLNISRWLKEGGLLILHAPSLGRKRYLGVAREDAAHAGGAEYGHVRDGYAEEDLKALLERAGFVVASVRRTFGRAAAWLTDLDYVLARARLHPLRVVTYVGSVAAARLERARPPRSGRGVLAVARRAAGAPPSRRFENGNVNKPLAGG